MMDLRTRSRVNPFYVPPSCIIKTTSEIISEARLAMSNSAVGRPVSNAMRPIQTKRPFTPREGQRTLFGLSNSRTMRPPSAISVRHVKFQDVEAVPKLPSLRPALHQLNFKGQRSPWHLPAIRDSVRKLKPFRTRTSLDNLPEEVETETSVEGFHSSFITRETHSSPKERTDLSDDEEPKSIIRKKQKKPILEAGLRRSWIPPDLYGTAVETLGNLSIDKRHAKPNPQLISQYSPLKTEGAKFGFASVINEADEAIEDNDEITNEENRKFQMFMDPKHIKPETRTKLSSFGQSFVSPRVKAIDELMDTEEAVDIMSHENQMNEAKAASKQATELDPPKKFETVEALLTTLTMIEEPDVNKSDLIPKLDSLACALEREEVVALRNSKVQSQVLKTLYRFVESADENVLLNIARVILSMRVSGPNLSAVCKLIFKVSRCDQNDQLFQEGDILGLFVESLGRASPLEDAEACIYGYGALKFLTMNNKLLDASHKHGTLPLMVLHLKIVNNARLELVPIPEQTSHAVFQLTGALRNTASEQATFPEFVQSGAIAELCRAMELFCADIDLVANIARTLSILSTDDECCQVIVNCDGSLRTIVKIFAKFPGRQDIVVRLGYALGNLMAKCNSARLKLFEEPGALSSILTLVENYLEKDLQLMCSEQERTQLVSSPEWGSDGSVEDVIVKMIRIVANMCMHSQVGMGLTCGVIDSEDEPYNLMDLHCTKDGGRFLDILLTVMRRKSVAEHDELVLSTLSTLNNLSFYSDPVCIHDGPFALRQMDIAHALSGLLISSNEDCLVETLRVFGNLTRTRCTRDFMLETGGVCHLVRCLESENIDLLRSTSGVLVNLMADWDKRLALKEDNGIPKLINVLAKYGEGDWKLAGLICQVLWNFSIDSTHLYAAFGVESTNGLLTVLLDLLDEERLFGVSEGCEVNESVAESEEYLHWEQFANVATDLLEKIERYLGTLEALGAEV